MTILGNYENQYPLVPIADIGGQRVLGMSGSLSNYINTGNAHIGPNDSFVPQKNDTKKPKKANIFEKISATGAPVIGYVIAAGVTGALLFTSIKNGSFRKFFSKIGADISEAYNKFNTNNMPKIKKFFKDLPGKVSNFFSDIADKLPFKKQV